MGGAIGLGDYLEAGSIAFLFTLADWLESRSSDKVTASEVSNYQRSQVACMLHGILSCMKFTFTSRKYCKILEGVADPELVLIV